MMGQIEFQVAGTRRIARLADDLRWTCDEPQVESLLNDRYPVLPCETSPVEVSARFALYRVSERLGGRVVVTAKRPHATLR